MSYGLYISAEGARAPNQRMQEIASNLANVNTTGFKRQLAVLQARHAESIESGKERAGSDSINDLGGGVLFKQMLNQLTAGVVKKTGIPTDMAIIGDGYFEILRDGQKFLTRTGNFICNNDGTLQTMDGYDVLSADGGPVQILPNQPWFVTRGGTISQAGNQIPLSVVKPQDPGDPVRIGQNMFSPLSQVPPIRPSKRQVVAGHLEQSSVEPVRKLIDLITTQRVFELNSQTVQAGDRILVLVANLSRL